MNIVSDKRPWGGFTRFTHNEPSTVKILTVEAGQETSLQFHHNRQEFWKVLSGAPTIALGDAKIDAVVGQEFFVEKEMQHRISAPNGKVEILEISFGDFDEADIVRTEDRYGR